METCLCEAAVALTPSTKQIRGYKSVLNHVVQMLHRSGYRIGRVRAGGSFGKDTGTSHKMDLDITFFLNGLEPPFGDCLAEIQHLIAQTFCISINSIKQTDCSLQFRAYSADIEKEVKVDLLPAANYVVEIQNSRDICGEQQRKTLEAIQTGFLKNRRLFRSSFTEAAVEFVKNQSQEVRQLVRLVKFWKDSVYFEGGVTGVSSTIELIAVHVGIKVEAYNGRFSMMKAFESFLKTITNIANERIVFTHQTLRGRCRAFYNDFDIPPHVASNKPLVLDPADPGNNRLYNPYIKEYFVKVLSVKAVESLVAFARARNCNSEDSRPYLTLTVLCPGPFGSLGKVPKVIETPSYISWKPCLDSSVTSVKLTRHGSCSTSEENWAKFLQRSYQHILFISTGLSLDVGRAVKEVFTNAARKQFMQLRTEPSFYQHDLTIATGSGSAIKIFIRWKPEGRIEHFNPRFSLGSVGATGSQCVKTLTSVTEWPSRHFSDTGMYDEHESDFYYDNDSDSDYNYDYEHDYGYEYEYDYDYDSDTYYDKDLEYDRANYSGSVLKAIPQAMPKSVATPVAPKTTRTTPVTPQSMPKSVATAVAPKTTRMTPVTPQAMPKSVNTAVAPKTTRTTPVTPHAMPKSVNTPVAPKTTRTTPVTPQETPLFVPSNEWRKPSHENICAPSRSSSTTWYEYEYDGASHRHWSSFVNPPIERQPQPLRRYTCEETLSTKMHEDSSNRRSYVTPGDKSSRQSRCMPCEKCHIL